MAETWSARGLASAGIRGTGQPIPAEATFTSSALNDSLGLDAEQPTWEDAVEDLQLVGVLPPQTQDVVLPADHLPQDQHDRDGGQADEQEERVGPLHHVKALLMAHHLYSRQSQYSSHSLLNKGG